MVGRTLGGYEVLAAIGAGGMGQVYKARDTRLNRLVAIKILHQDLASNPARRQRFLQEARSASALNHPNIITIHDIFECDGLDCLVMEYLDGETLYELIPKQGMDVAEALRIASQVAEGLSKAHRAGLVHRDIKPSNILVAGGAVKILDFGLAKTLGNEKISESDSTRTVAPITEEGVVVGTVCYMSPEQAQGKPVDSRSDIFSFGSLLYEMLTGRRAYSEDSNIGTLAAILHREPLALPRSIPTPIVQIILKCLRKPPEQRWQDFDEVKRLIDDAAANPRLTFPVATPLSRSQKLFWAWMAVVGAVGGLVTYGVFRFVPRSRESAAVVLHKITADSGLTGYPAISRDGKLIAFASDRAQEDNLDIWVQQTGSGDPIRLTHGPADESDPSFSPDGTLIAFRSEKDGGGIYVIPSLGGTPTLLAPRGRDPRFSPDGKWVAYSVGGSAISNPGTAGVFIVSPGGGVPRPIHSDMATATNPVWSPTSDRLLVLGRKDPKAPARSELDWWILPIDGKDPIRSGAYARLSAQSLVAPQFPQVYPAALDWREGDRILFSAFSGEAANLWELSLDGNDPARRVTLGPGMHSSASWSGDGRQLVFASQELGFDVWLQPLDSMGGARGEMKRITTESIENFAPSVTDDGVKTAYVRHRSGDFSLRLRETTSKEERTVFTSPTRIYNARLSGDGTRIIYTNADYDLLSIASTGGAAQKLCDRCGTVTGLSDDGSAVLFEPLQNEDVMLYDPSHTVPVRLAIRPSADLLLSGARFSRDGRWIAFHALRNVANTSQIWIAPSGPAIPVPPSVWIAVTNGSQLDRDPAWSPDGRVLYFISERDGFRCIWGQPLQPGTKQPSGNAFAVRHFHSARFSLRHVGSRGALIGLSAGEGSLIFSMGELKSNVWLQEDAK